MLSLVFNIVSAWFAFLLPAYATFKALSYRPATEQDLHRWAKYWSVVGVFVAFEYTAGWFLSWLPFYWEAKTIFLLYLALPQSQGSTYVYNNYLQPFFSKNESDLDEGIVKIQKNMLAFIQSRMAALWEFIMNAVNRPPPSTTTTARNGGTGTSTGVSLTDTAFNLWQNYGPSFMSRVYSGGTAPAQAAPTEERP